MIGPSIADLPQEIMIEIFSKLPAKSIGKCRLLSKFWRTFLSSPQFIKTHLTRFPPLQENLILITRHGSLFTITLGNDEPFSRKIELPGSSWCEVVGSSNGLVLLANEGRQKLLVNPTTLQQVQIPNPPLALNSIWLDGFGYDSITDDYKIVTLSHYAEEQEGIFDTIVELFSLRSGVWRRLESCPYDFLSAIPQSGNVVNGALHWLVFRRGSNPMPVIAAFDLVDEVFYEIPAPSCVNKSVLSYNELVVLGRSLCVIDNRMVGNDRTRCDVWLMREYCLEESWTRCIVSYEGRVRPLCYIGDKEVLLETEEKLIVYDLKEGSSRDMVFDGEHNVFIDGGTFVESLVSPAICTWI